MELSAVSCSKTIASSSGERNEIMHDNPSIVTCNEEKNQLLHDNSSIDTSDEESVRKLFDRENSIGFKRTESFVYNDDRHRRARFRAIIWILRTTTILGFQSETAYLSVVYFDRYVSKKSIYNEDLLSMACLSIAAKVKESKNVPLSENQHGDCKLGMETRTRMERLVLNTLEWKLHLVTPFDFLPFFIKEKSNKSSSAYSHLLSDVIITIMKDINLMEIRPSTVAVAAILRVMDQSLTTRRAIQFSMRTVSCSHFLDMEDVFQCYKLMLQHRLDTDVGCFWKCFSFCLPFRL